MTEDITIERTETDHHMRIEADATTMDQYIDKAHDWMREEFGDRLIDCHAKHMIQQRFDTDEPVSAIWTVTVFPEEA